MDEKGGGGHLIGIKDMAQSFKVSPGTVREWIELGMPCYQIGNTFHSNQSEIWAWLKSSGMAKPVK